MLPRNPNFCRSHDDMTPLHLACIEGHAQIVNELLRAGADPLACVRPSGMTPLHLVARSRDGSPEIAQLLLASGSRQTILRVEDNIDRYTPLHVACMHDNIEVVRKILDAARSTENVQGNDLAPCLLADKAASEDSLLELINRESPDRLHTPLLCACGANSTDISQILLDHGAELTNVFKKQNTTPPPLAIAARNGNISLSMLLVAHGANPNIKTPHGHTMSGYALHLGHARLAYILQTTVEMSPAQLLAQTGLHERARQLLNRGMLDPCEVGGMTVYAAKGPVSRLSRCRTTRRYRSNKHSIAPPREHLRTSAMNTNTTQVRFQPSATEISIWGGYFKAVTAIKRSASYLEPLQANTNDATSVLFKEAAKHWAPSRHSLFGPHVRRAIRTLLLVHCRQRRHTAQPHEYCIDDNAHESGRFETALHLNQACGDRDGNGDLYLPVEMWHLVFQFLRRKDFMKCESCAISTGTPTFYQETDARNNFIDSGCAVTGDEPIDTSQYQVHAGGNNVATKSRTSTHGCEGCTTYHTHHRPSRIIRMRSADDGDDTNDDRMFVNTTPPLGNLCTARKQTHVHNRLRQGHVSDT